MNTFIKLFIAVLFLSTSAFSQGTWISGNGIPFNNPFSADAENQIQASMNRLYALKYDYAKTLTKLGTARSASAYTPARSATPSAKTEARSAPVLPPATKFKPTGTRILMPKLVAEFTKNKEHQTVLIQTFSDAMKQYEIEAKAGGFENDVAGAIAYFAVVAFYLQDGVEPSDKGSEALTKALQVVLDNPEYRKTSNADKQNFYEFMLTMGTFLLIYAQDADEAQLKEVRDVSTTVCTKFLSLDPAKFKLTDQGLVAR